MDIIYRYDTSATAVPRSTDTADAAVRELLAGHARYRRIVAFVEKEVSGGSSRDEPLVIPSESQALRFTVGVTPPQTPFAVVLGCSDARAPIERIFDQPPNALFVVRVAGNVLGTECLGSIEYAARHLKESVRLLVVLGHSSCGAVTAAVDSYLSPDDYHAVALSHSLRSLVDRIQIAVRGAAKGLALVGDPDIESNPGYRAALLETAIYLNAALTAFDVRREILAVGVKTIRVVYGVFDIADQKVHSLPHHRGEPEAPLFGDVPRTSEEFSTLAQRIAQAVMAQGKI
jgi:carbonic anhydrase